LIPIAQDDAKATYAAVKKKRWVYKLGYAG